MKQSIWSYKVMKHYSNPCEEPECDLCKKGSATHRGMVRADVSSFKVGTKLIKVKADLNCSNYGIYIAVCKKCPNNQAAYVGKTDKSFTERWTKGHMQAWKGLQCREENNCQALKIHYQKKHPEFYKENPVIVACYSVYFVEKPIHRRLSDQEKYWMNELQPYLINIQQPEPQ
ncbi:unnamed protein product [Clavelina lepadiformis]|uniref:GIY-YIG domain-containing protein n=1 Tax=Clavelina lepadiformis TaxID=159417 RepID=A0ABP0FNE4_CLALP